MFEQDNRVPRWVTAVVATAAPVAVVGLVVAAAVGEGIALGVSTVVAIYSCRVCRFVFTGV